MRRMENRSMIPALSIPTRPGNVLTAKGAMITHRVGIALVSRLVSLQVSTRNPRGTVYSPAKETKRWLKWRKVLSL